MATDTTDTTTTTDMSPLLRMVSTTASDYWNDSCAIAELEYAVANGAVGATSNPSIVGEVMKKEWEVWQPRVLAIRDEHPTWTDVEITWRTIEEMAARGAKVLEPIWLREAGRKGRLSIQTNPTFFRDPQRMLEQGRYFHTLAPNMQVKFPATNAGLRALEDATYHGVSINATVNFTLPQALAVGEAVERALRRREAEGLDVAHMAPGCTLMIGRLDDWMKASWERHVDDQSLPVAEASQRLGRRGAAALRRSGPGCPRRGAVRAHPRLPPRLRRGRPHGRRVRYVRRHGAHAAQLHRRLLGPRQDHRRDPAAAYRPAPLTRVGQIGTSPSHATSTAAFGAASRCR